MVAQYQAPELLPLGAPPEALPELRVAVFTVGLNVFGFMAVAGLSGYLAEGLRRTGAQLEQASTQLEDLQAFNQHVIDSLTSGLATCDMEGRMLTFNRAAEAITALAASDAVGRRDRRDPAAARALPEPVRARRDPVRAAAAASSATTAGTAARSRSA